MADAFRKSDEFKFSVGQLVHHRRYGYRGVVFDRDPVCSADEDWYNSNLTQPPRDKPWYHVLVDGAMHTTYVAEDNLEPDTTGAPVRHPLVNKIFEGFAKGRYVRQGLN